LKLEIKHVQNKNNPATNQQQQHPTEMTLFHSTKHDADKEEMDGTRREDSDCLLFHVWTQLGEISRTFTREKCEFNQDSLGEVV
jgi:hypothetical protein